MAEVVKFEMTKSEAEQLSAMMEQVIAEIDRAQERMAKDQQEIDRLRADTQKLLARDWRGGVNVEAILGSVSPRFDLVGNH